MGLGVVGAGNSGVWMYPGQISPGGRSRSQHASQPEVGKSALGDQQLQSGIRPTEPLLRSFESRQNAHAAGRSLVARVHAPGEQYARVSLLASQRQFVGVRESNLAATNRRLYSEQRK